MSLSGPSDTSCQETSHFTISHMTARASLSSGSICRICYEDGKKEHLISPCKCSGSMGLLHKSCIEKWLGSSNTEKCEICQFEYITVKQPQSLKQWLSAPSHRRDRRNLICDSVCFLILTPLATISAWLCSCGAITYSQYQNYYWETVGLISLTVFLVLVYIVWITIALHYHVTNISVWRRNHFNIHVIGLEEFSLKSQQDETRIEMASIKETESFCSVPSPSNTSIDASQRHMALSQSVPIKYLTDHTHTVNNEEDDPQIIHLGTNPTMGSYLDWPVPARRALQSMSYEECTGSHLVCEPESSGDSLDNHGSPLAYSVSDTHVMSDHWFPQDFIMSLSNCDMADTQNNSAL